MWSWGAATTFPDDLQSRHLGIFTKMPLHRQHQLLTQFAALLRPLEDGGWGSEFQTVQEATERGLTEQSCFYQPGNPKI